MFNLKQKAKDNPEVVIAIGSVAGGLLIILVSLHFKYKLPQNVVDAVKTLNATAAEGEIFVGFEDGTIGVISIKDYAKV